MMDAFDDAMVRATKAVGRVNEINLRISLLLEERARLVDEADHAEKVAARLAETEEEEERFFQFFGYDSP